MVDLFLTKHLVLVSCEVPRKIAARSDVFFCCFSYVCSTFAASSTDSLSEIPLHMLKFGLLCPCWGEKIFLRKTKNKTTGTAWHVMSLSWSILSQTIALDQSAARIRSVILKLRMVVYHLENVSGKYSWKVNRKGPFGVVPAENFREQRNIWKVSTVFRYGMFQTGIRVPFLQSYLLVSLQFQSFAAVFR